MTAPRIDTIKNRLATTIELLTLLREELDDLHVLAYDRPAAVEEAKVAGGSANYYLDTHGDLRARAAYQHLWRTVDSICNTINGASNDALKLLREGDTPSKGGPRTTHLADLGEAIAARTRRADRGDYTAVRRGPQPDEGKAMEELRKQRDAARAALVEVTRQRDQALAQNRRANDRRRSA